MSSATSTDAAQQVRLTADPTPEGIPQQRGTRSQPDQSLQPWQFFVLAALACATAVTFLARGQGFVAVILLSVLMGTAAIAGLAALRTVLPLVTGREDRTPVVGERTRAALEREKMLALRAIKEMEFDRAMGKLSEDDFREMSGRLRARATRLMKQLDAGAGYRDRIEKDLAKRMGEKDSAGPKAAPGPKDPAYVQQAVRGCPKCSTANDADARFCKSCGTQLS